MMKQDRLMERFVEGETARTAAELVGVHRNTAVLFYMRLRKLIAEKMEKASPFNGHVKMDNLYCNGHRKDRCDLDEADKMPVFGFLAREGKVYTAMIRNPRAAALTPIIEQIIVPDSIVYVDNPFRCNALGVSAFHHVRINHSRKAVGESERINDIEAFWSHAKRHFRRFNGIPRQHFPLFLKECEWRFNYSPSTNLFNTLSHWSEDW